jgi:hypothetical protein
MGLGADSGHFERNSVVSMFLNPIEEAEKGRRKYCLEHNF